MCAWEITSSGDLVVGGFGFVESMVQVVGPLTAPMFGSSAVVLFQPIACWLLSSN
jgi:hypothetical protein